jgi:lantibiotic modifying enzyme
MTTDFIAEARAIGDSLIRDARAEPDHSITWGRGEDSLRLPCPDSGPFNGRVGDAIFLAALYRVTGRDVYRVAARAAVLTLCSMADDETFVADLFARLGVGLRGIGGIIYALQRTGEFADAPEALRGASSIAITAASLAIPDPLAPGVLFGGSGFILGLGSLDRSNNCFLDAVARYGDAILRLSLGEVQERRVAWEATAGAGATAGFAHGSTGVAAALFRAARMTSRTAFLDAAVDALRFERSLYDAEADRWREFETDQGGIVSWCHRATGFGFARLVALEDDQPESGEANTDLVTALRLTLRHPLSNLDGLCCGNFGRVELLLESGYLLEDHGLTHHAFRLGRVVVDRARFRGYGLPQQTGHLAPGLWQGLSGIGYALLRLGAPNVLPCLLTLS